METVGDKGVEVVERTMPAEIADLDIEVQAMFESVAAKLKLPTPLTPRPHKVDRYELQGEKLGVGGMGSVYRAYDPKLERPVAIKLVSPRSLTNANKLRERLRQEALMLAKFDHPNIVTVFDAGVDNGRVFLAMELVEGETLRERQDRPDCSFDERLRLYIEAGRGLAAAHGQGVVHRDFKPDNVFVDEDGRARVGDFGLAYAIGEHEIEDTRESTDPSPVTQRMTQTGEFLGTLGYSAPEQLRGQELDARSDQYAFCVAVWESLCGEKPYVGDTREELLAAMERSEPRGGKQLPSRLRRALLVGLSPHPQQRYPDMNAVIRMLERELQRPERLRRRFSWGGAAVLSVAGILAMWSAHEVLNPLCPLAETFAKYPSTEEWSSFAEALPSSAKHLEAGLQALDDEAHAVCVNEDQNRYRTQQLHRVERHLKLLPSYAPDRYNEFARELENVLVAGPTQPLTPKVEQFLAIDLEPLEADALFPDIITASSTALKDRAVTPVDRAELLLRRGRAYSLDGQYESAVDDFREAWWLAEEGFDDERRLRAYSEYAKTLIMRFEEFERGSDFVYSAQKLLAAVDESVLSPRRAAVDELEARLARHDGRFVEALSLQRRAVWRDVLAGRFFDLVPRFVNLGNIHDDLGNPRAAVICYRAALQLDPTDPEARLNLGRLLVNELALFDNADEARELLDSVLASGHRDTRLAAAVSALQLEIQLGDSTMVVRRRAALVELLEAQHPGTDIHVLDGWYYVVSAYAVEDDLGPGFDAALEQLLPLLDAEYRAALEVDLTDIVGPERARLLLEQPPTP